MIPRRRIALDPADLRDVWRTLWTSQAQAKKDVSAFEAAFAAAVGVDHAIAVASGRDAMRLILQALGFGRGDELIVPAYTLGELVPLIGGDGLIPVPADVDPTTFNLTPETVAARIGPKTRGIFALHAFGAPCDIVGLRKLADSHGLKLIEDCAHAVGAHIGHQPVGCFGDAALFSLEATKAVSAFGGGVATTNDAQLANRLRTAVANRPRREWPAIKKALFKTFEELAVRSPLYAIAARLLFSPDRASGFDRFYRQAHGHLRVAAGFSAFQARVGLRKLANVPQRNARLNVAWQALAAELPDGFTTQRRDLHGEPAFYNFVVRSNGDLTRQRMRLQQMGIDAGIGGEVMDDIAPTLDYGDCHASAQLGREALLLPLYDDLSAPRRRQLLGALHRLAQEAA